MGILGRFGEGLHAAVGGLWFAHGEQAKFFIAAALVSWMVSNTQVGATPAGIDNSAV